MQQNKSRYQFGPFSLDADERVLLREGRLVPLPAKAVSTLLVLVRMSGHVVEKDVLMNEVWPDEIVEENNLAQNVFILRRALGETDLSKYIETVPRRGYRFLGAVQEITAPVSVSPTKPKNQATDRQEQAIVEEAAPGRSNTESSAANRAYLKGRYYWSKFTQASLEQAIVCFKQAVDLDPSYARAYVGIADSYIRLGATHVSPTQVAAKAKEAVSTALRLDEDLAEAYASLGKFKMDYEWDWDGAGQQLRLALELNPRYATAHLWYGTYLESVGRLDEALVEKTRALEFDPVSLHVNISIASTLWLMRRADEAIVRIQETLEMDENFVPAHVLLGFVKELKRDFSGSMTTLEKARGLDDSLFVLAYLGRAYAIAGREAKARKIVAELEQESRKRYVSPYSIALIMEGLGEIDLALAWLEKASAARDVWLFWIRVDPRLDGLRSNSRFKVLEEQIFSPRTPQPAARSHTEKPEAQQAYLAGRRAWATHRRAGLEQAAVHFEKAFSLDPEYAVAYAAAIDSYLRLATNYFPPSNKRSESEPTREANEYLAGDAKTLQLGNDWNVKVLERESYRARELGLNCLTRHQWHAAYQLSRTLFRESVNQENVASASAASQALSKSPAIETEVEYLEPTEAEQLQVACAVARAQIETGNYEAARVVLKHWWTFGEWPKFEGLSPESSADLLTTAGTLTGFLASTTQVSKGEKHGEALLNGAIALLEQLGSETLVAEAQIELALCYYREGSFSMARQTLNRALAKISGNEMEIRSVGLVRLAFVEWQAGRLYDSLSHLTEAGEIVQSVGPITVGRYHLALANFFLVRGKVEARREDLREALTKYNEALLQETALGNHRYLAVVENDIGYVLLLLGELEEAESHLVRAREWFESLQDPRRRALVDESLAELHVAAGRFDAAERAVNDAVGTFEAGSQEAFFAQILTTQGVVLCKLGRYREAKRALDRACQVAERCGDSEGAGTAMLVQVEEMIDRLDADERQDIGARLEKLLAGSQRASTLERLKKCLKMLGIPRR
jgi:DNA-binding winged helix-turn-helix (wHTH) protein/predicted negative regulator of RcsB-dependent stress response